MSLKLVHTITVEKKFERKPADGKMKAQVAKLRDRALSGGRAERGWNCSVAIQENRTKFLNHKGAIYYFDLKFVYNPRQERNQQQVDKELANIVQIVQSAAKKTGWGIDSVNGKPYIVQGFQNEDGQQMIPYAACEIRGDWHKFYQHIYDRENQINIIMTRIQAAIDSDWTNRFHCALVGEPAGGKTETARGFRAVLGEAAVLELDATSTTQAGVIKELSERSELPRVIIIEEIEKADFKQLPWLLSMLDPRGEISKLNFRSKILFQMRGLCIATINNWKLFQNILEGALASRFGDPIFFPRPSEVIIRKILTREVDKIKGNPAWISPTLEHCKEMGITDPRSALSICLSGKDLLLGKKEYQKMLKATSIPDDYKN